MQVSARLQCAMSALDGANGGLSSEYRQTWALLLPLVIMSKDIGADTKANEQASWGGSFWAPLEDSLHSRSIRQGVGLAPRTKHSQVANLILAATRVSIDVVCKFVL
jgi:hypothetical protein